MEDYIQGQSDFVQKIHDLHIKYFNERQRSNPRSTEQHSSTKRSPADSTAPRVLPGNCERDTTRFSEEAAEIGNKSVNDHYSPHVQKIMEELRNYISGGKDKGQTQWDIFESERREKKSLNEQSPGIKRESSRPTDDDPQPRAFTSRKWSENSDNGPRSHTLNKGAKLMQFNGRGKGREEATTSRDYLAQDAQDAQWVSKRIRNLDLSNEKGTKAAPFARDPDQYESLWRGILSGEA